MVIRFTNARRMLISWIDGQIRSWWMCLRPTTKHGTKKAPKKKGGKGRKKTQLKTPKKETGVGGHACAQSSTLKSLVYLFVLACVTSELVNIEKTAIEKKIHAPKTYAQ